MAFVSVTPAVLGEPASSVENNKIISNCIDLDSRVTSNTGIITHATTGNAALGTRVTALESGGVVGLKKAVYPSQNTSLTSTASAETDIPKLQVLSLPVTSGVLYRFNYYLAIQGTVAGDTGVIWLRRTNPVTGPVVQGRTFHISSVGSPIVVNMSFYWIASGGSPQSFYVSHQRSIGTGTMQCYQDANQKNYVEVFHVGVPGGGVIETPA